MDRKVIYLSAIFALAFTKISEAENKDLDATCVNGKINKEALAQYLLDKYKFSWRAESYQQLHASPELLELSHAQQLIAQGSFCPKPDSTQAEKCSDDDITAIAEATTEIESLLTNQVPGFRSNGKATSPKSYFLMDSASIFCPTNISTRSQEAATSKEPSIGGWRLRGAADQIYIRRPSTLFSSADKFQAGFTDDKVKGKSAKKIVGDIGYAFDIKSGQLDANGNVLQIAPYVGINNNVSRIKGSPNSYSENTRNAGVAMSLQWSSGHARSSTSYVIQVRPDYLWNKANASRLLSTNVGFTPFIKNWINAPVAISSDEVLIIPLADLRFDYGHYTTFGRAPNGTLADYSRVGSRLGFAITTTSIANHPVDWSVTKTFLYGFHGLPRNIQYFKATLSFGFDTKRIFSLDISYSSGRREDSGERERGWSLGFGAKY